MKVNQSFIAEKLSLSVATISKSLRNDPEIHPETRAQVVALAARLGYRTPASRPERMRARDRQQVPSYCLLLQSDTRLDDSPHEQDPLRDAQLVMAGVSEACHTADAMVSIHYVPLRDLNSFHKPEFQPVALREGFLSGVVLYHYYPPAIVEALSRQVPVVDVSRSSINDPVDSVDCDSSHSMSQVVRHLAALGHRRIGYLSAFTNHGWHQDRFGAFVQTMLSLGLPFDPTIAQANKEDDESQTDRIVQATRDGVTAWVTGSDSIAYAWARRFRAAGIEVGRDVAMTGFDAFPAPVGFPRLTSVHVPFTAMGRAAISLLSERRKDHTLPVRRVSLRGSLISGESTPSVAAIEAARR